MMVSMMISLVLFSCVCLANMANTGVESIDEWITSLPKQFWLCNLSVLMSFFMLTMANLIFIYAASKDFQRRNYVSELLN